MLLLATVGVIVLAAAQGIAALILTQPAQNVIK